MPAATCDGAGAGCPRPPAPGALVLVPVMMSVSVFVSRVEQLFRDARVLQIYGGTDEIQISQIARSLLETA